MSIPTKDEIRAKLKKHGLSCGGLTRLLGLPNNRRVREWTGGFKKIPYAYWRLFLLEFGDETPYYLRNKRI